jgi:hypothetical protein
MNVFFTEKYYTKNFQKHLRRIWYFLHLCSIKTFTMKSLINICSSNNAIVAISGMRKRSMVVAFNKERMDYSFDYGSRTR